MIRRIQQCYQGIYKQQNNHNDSKQQQGKSNVVSQVNCSISNGSDNSSDCKSPFEDFPGKSMFVFPYHLFVIIKITEFLQAQSGTHQHDRNYKYLCCWHKGHQQKSCYCLLYTSPSPRDGLLSRMPSSA